MNKLTRNERLEITKLSIDGAMKWAGLHERSVVGMALSDILREATRIYEYAKEKTLKDK